LMPVSLIGITFGASVHVRPTASGRRVEGH